MTVPANRRVAAWGGVLAAAAGIGVAELLAVLTRPVAAPLTAVASAVVDLTPAPVRETVIGAAGTADKLILLAGVVLVLAWAAGRIGVLLTTRPRWGWWGLAAVTAIGVAAAVTRPSAGWWAPAPTLVGAGVAAILLHRMRRAVHAPDDTQDESKDDGHDDERDGGAGLARPDRRDALRLGAVAAALAVTSGGLAWVWRGGRGVAERSRQALRLPAPSSPAPPVPAAASAPVAGAVPYLTPTATFYRIDTALLTPDQAAADWSLTIHGMVRQHITLNYQQLLELPLVERVVTLACVSNEVGGQYLGTARWLGPLLSDVLASAGVDPAADQILCRSADGMTIGTPARIALDGRDAMLAVGMNGEPLPPEHGFPVRMVVPGLYGYCSACKWLVDMELTTFAARSAYWVQRGWARSAPILTQSRIDTPRDGTRLAAGRVAVAGVAWAQHRGISGVELRVDDGPWRRAELASQPSVDAWRQWWVPWEATPGRHRLTVRATDGTGATQTADRAGPAPSGATGWHSVTVTVG